METIFQNTRKARKTHKCDWCGGDIEKEEDYDYSFNKDGDVYVWKNHKRCMAIAHELDMFDYDYGVGDQDFQEHINEEYYILVNEDDMTKRTFLERLDYVCERKLTPTK
ncbi:hypothetical protein [Flagellimonas sp. CMM7]|uniref:hypothetical protein n=1 Tax=Flagellimonas sp. CMM7 TaxID=2654676 RepID=UPI0013D1EE0F|nr:hypothetical protein [Flagellimonas sp. CMM7]UII80030.1 hypothetical protein LV704_00565 [Flagellimonas sp. CMM7]